jgi:hypothetical protein
MKPCGWTDKRIAAVFWDLHDTHDDGQTEDSEDSLNFDKWAGVVSLYLKNAKDKISEYVDPIVNAGVGTEARSVR